MLAILSGAFLFVSAITALGARMRRTVEQGNQLSASLRRQSEEAMANLQTLNRDELRVLFGMLQSGTRRFAVTIGDEKYPLLQRGILVERSRVDAATSMCDFDSAILANRERIVDLIMDAHIL